jgi:hypothetical protein
MEAAMPNDDDDNEPSGYRRPPKSQQFKKGQSGNPTGRPKASQSFKNDLVAELQEKLIVVENGKERRVTKQRAFVKTLTAAAIKKDIRAVNALLACIRLFGVEPEDQASQMLDTGDLDILESYLKRERQKQASVNPHSKLKKGK